MKFKFELYHKKAVNPNHKGFLFVNKGFKRMLEPGVYKFSKLSDKIIDIYSIPVANQWVSVVNQEILTKDNISLRLSYDIEYKVTDYDQFRQFLHLNINYSQTVFLNVEQQIRSISQTLIRNIVAGVQSEVINERRAELLGSLSADMQESVNDYGVTLCQVLLKDISFPKKIQELFARQLEVNIRSKADLDKARTQVATARALKNAADLMRDNENIKFLQMMETMTQIAASGKHTFMIGGEMLQPNKK